MVSHAIFHQTWCPNTQQNGVVKCENEHLSNTFTESSYSPFLRDLHYVISNWISSSILNDRVLHCVPFFLISFYAFFFHVYLVPYVLYINLKPVEVIQMYICGILTLKKVTMFFFYLEKVFCAWYLFEFVLYYTTIHSNDDICSYFLAISSSPLINILVHYE